MFKAMLLKLTNHRFNQIIKRNLNQEKQRVIPYIENYDTKFVKESS